MLLVFGKTERSKYPREERIVIVVYEVLTTEGMRTAENQRETKYASTGKFAQNFQQTPRLLNKRKREHQSCLVHPQFEIF